MTTNAAINLESRRRQVRLSAGSWSAAPAQMIVASLMVLLVVACSSGDPPHVYSDSEDPPHVYSDSEDPPHVYSDEELGLDEVVGHDIILRSLPYSRYRTGQEIDRDSSGFHSWFGTRT